MVLELLDRHAVHLWWINIEDQAPSEASLAATLSSDERARAARLRNADLRRQFTVTRGVVRTILSRYTDVAPSDLWFHYGAAGKPKLGGNAGREISFNVSHSAGLAVCAVARRRMVGVDLEHVRPVLDVGSLAAAALTDSEGSELWRVPAPEREEAFLRFWTLKEAYLKATGRGLTQSFKTFEVSAALQTQLVKENKDDVLTWTVHSPECPRGYVAALALEGPVFQLTSRWWTAD